jgi:DNA replication and repair protein RecF
VVLFTPADLTLVSGSPGDRRRYLDITLSQIDPHYVRTLSQYNRLVQQRNSLLRSWRERRRPLRAVDSELEYWDRELSTNGGYLLAERLRAIADLNTIGGPLFCDIMGSAQPLEIDYQPSFDTKQATSADDLAQQFVGSLQRLRRDELQRGQTLIGPHRDDLLFTAGTVNLGIYGSRGQQRSIALALKLAEARLMQNRTSETPVLLLDDVLSELDLQRRAHLLRAISQPQQQIVLTATDLGSFDAEFLQQITCLRVEEGRIYPLS